MLPNLSNLSVTPSVTSVDVAGPDAALPQQELTPALKRQELELIRQRILPPPAAEGGTPEPPEPLRRFLSLPVELKEDVDVIFAAVETNPVIFWRDEAREYIEPHWTNEKLVLLATAHDIFDPFTTPSLGIYSEFSEQTRKMYEEDTFVMIRVAASSAHHWPYMPIKLMQQNKDFVINVLQELMQPHRKQYFHEYKPGPLDLLPTGYRGPVCLHIHPHDLAWWWHKIDPNLRKDKEVAKAFFEVAMHTRGGKTNSIVDSASIEGLFADFGEQTVDYYPSLQEAHGHYFVDFDIDDGWGGRRNTSSVSRF